MKSEFEIRKLYEERCGYATVDLWNQGYCHALKEVLTPVPRTESQNESSIAFAPTLILLVLWACGVIGLINLFPALAAFIVSCHYLVMGFCLIFIFEKWRR